MNTTQPPASTPITITATLQYLNAPVQNQALSISNKRVSIQGRHFIAGTMAVPTAAGGTAIPLVGLASLGFAMLVNNDQANYVEVLTGVGGIAFAQIQPGEPLLIRFGPGVTAPALVANAAPCDVEYLILEA